MKLHRIAFVLASIVAAGTASAGTAKVSFIQPERFADAGYNERDRDANLTLLSRHFERLARGLPANQVLKVDVLDVDLAGELPTGRVASHIRIVRGRADFPRMHLRYALEEDGRVLRSGDEWVQDLDYTFGAVEPLRSTQPLYYDKRMLNTWFREHIASPG